MCCQELRKSLGGQEVCFGNRTVLQEKGKKCEILSLTEEICTIYIDHADFPIPEEHLKCDGCFVRCKEHSFHFVELKGQNLTHAVRQIEATVSWFRTKAGIPLLEQTFGYIICARVTLSSSKLQNLKAQFRKRTGRKLVVKSRTHIIK